MPEIAFKVNEFRVYEVNVEGVAFGFINTGSGGYTPAKGELFQYDGNTVILKDGREFTDITQLRNAIHAGWCSEKTDAVAPPYRPKSAGIQVRGTEQRGTGRPTRVSVETVQSDERTVVSVADRTRSREATNERAARQTPLETEAARSVVPQAVGDEGLDELVASIEEDMEDWLEEQESERLLEEMLAEQAAREGAEEAQHEEEVQARAEADILSLLASVEDDAGAEQAPSRPVPKTAPARRSARNLPVDAQEDRVTMPIVREDETEQGTVIGSVQDGKRTVVRRENELAMNVAPARPPTESPKPRARIGGTGAIVVDEQRDMGQIALSGSKAPIRLDESAKVTSGQTETIRMGEGAQVGTKKTAHAVQTAQGQEGVAVGRVLSPTVQSFEANDSNTSSTAIQRAQEGKQLRVEKFETDDEVVATVSDGAVARAEAVATGDVQEATSGDTLEDVLPDAATGPRPEVHRRPEEDPAYAAIKMLVPDFEWNKDRRVSERVQAAMKHIENPLYIKGILAVETELAREEIKKALAVELDRRQEAKKAKKAK